MRSRVAAYGVSLAVVAAAILVRVPLYPLLADRLPFITLFPAIALIARYCGRGPASLALVISSLAVAFFISEPRYSFALRQAEHQAGLILYMSIGLGFIAMFESLRKATLQVVEQRERLRTTLTDGFCTLDKDWRFTFVNDHLVERFGLPREQIIGRNFWELFPQSVESVAYVRLHRAMNERVPVEYEIFVEPWQKWIFDKAAPTADGGLAIYSADITNRKQTELALSFNEQRLRAFLENSAIIAWLKDEEGRYVFLSDNYVRRFDLKDWMGKTDFQLWPADVAETFRRNDEAVLQLSKPLECIEEARTADGRSIWLNSKFWFRDQAGKKFVGGVGVDITERKQAEEQVRRGAELLTFLIDRSPSGFYIVDSDFRISHINADSQARAFRNVNPAIGRHLDDAMRVLWPEPLATQIIAIFRHTMETGEPYNSPGLVSPRADLDSVETYEWQLQRITMPDGPFAVVCYYYDSTALRQAEAALRDADRRKDEFLATLAHELRNPLAPVRNAVQLLQMKGPEVPELRWARDVIERQMQQMTRLIDDLMDVSRISQGKIELKRERVALATVFREAVETSRPHIEQFGHELTVDLPPQTVYLDADLTRLAQVFANLLNNAAKYTERGGAIRLTAERQGSDVVVSVQDSGIGIPRDKLLSVFELFSQVQGALERSQGGLGIGLSLGKKLVEMHGGTIEARSEGPGTGSEFVVRLPLIVEQQSAGARRGSDAEEVAASSLRILIVDDNRDAADSLGMMLQLLGNDTRTAYDGEEAVQAAGDFRPQMVLLDIGLPKLNGYEACRRIRQESWGKRMALIAVTGWGQEEDKRKAEEAGFDRHLVKPVDPRGLIKLLGELLKDPLSHER